MPDIDTVNIDWLKGHIEIMYPCKGENIHVRIHSWTDDIYVIITTEAVRMLSLALQTRTSRKIPLILLKDAQIEVKVDLENKLYELELTTTGLPLRRIHTMFTFEQADEFVKALVRPI